MVSVIGQKGGLLVQVGTITTMEQAAVDDAPAVELMAANTARRGLILINHGPDAVFLNFDTTATSSNGLKLANGAVLVLDRVVPTKAVSAICASGATATVGVCEL